MRKIGSVLMFLGAFCLVAAVLEVFGPFLRRHGVEVFGVVTSVKGVGATGILLLVLGAALRRRRAPTPR